MWTDLPRERVNWHSKSDRSIDGKRKNLLKTIDKAIDKIEKANGFDGDDYKNQVLKHMRLNKSLLNHDYAAIVGASALVFKEMEK